MFQKGHKINLDRRHTKEFRLKISESKREEKSYLWKGDKVGYKSLHKWVTKYKGHPKKCEICGMIGEFKIRVRFGKEEEYWSLVWANKDGRYERKLEDYLGFCQKCHMEFDKRLFTAGIEKYLRDIL